MGETRTKDGKEWLIGGDAEAAWIVEATIRARTIDAAIPPVFDSYCTLLLPGFPDHSKETKLSAYDEAVVARLSAHTSPQPWWLGYLDTGASDIVFFDAETVTLYAGWNYVLIEAGPEQALNFRAETEHVWNGPLPDLMFPADRSWLLSTLWDDAWSCIGGSEALVGGFDADPQLGPLTRRVRLGEDATPPGLTSL